MATFSQDGLFFDSHEDVDVGKQIQLSMSGDYSEQSHSLRNELRKNDFVIIGQSITFDGLELMWNYKCGILLPFGYSHYQYRFGIMNYVLNRPVEINNLESKNDKGVWCGIKLELGYVKSQLSTMLDFGKFIVPWITMEYVPVRRMYYNFNLLKELENMPEVSDIREKCLPAVKKYSEEQ